MYMLRLALLAVLRLAIFGILKLALYAYVLTLPDAAVAGAASKRDGRGGTAPSFAAQKLQPSGRRYPGAAMI
jgi:hypothetical protein